MGKRSKEDDRGNCGKKTRKSKRKHKRAKRRRRHSSSSTTSCESTEVEPMVPNRNETDGSPAEMDTMYEFIDEEMPQIDQDPTCSAISDPAPSTSAQPLPSTSAAARAQLSCSDQAPENEERPAPTVETALEDAAPAELALLDPLILELLGDDPTAVNKYGKEIQADLAVRLQHVIANGISKELRKELQEKYLPPSNCMLVDAPMMNPEMFKVISDAVLKRDKGIEAKQKQLGSAISCLGEALTILLSQKERDSALIKILMDACRLLCDCQNLDSNTRRNFVLFNLTKDHKDQLQKTKIDNFLFGADLAQTIKTSKDLCQSAAALANSRNPRPMANKNNNNNRPFANQPPQRNNLNWKLPPPARRPKGTYRAREPAPPPPPPLPAPRNQPANYSRPSYRDRPPAPATHYRNRR